MKDATKVAIGLFGAWCANDLEELVTMKAGSRVALSRLPSWLPLPDRLRERGFSQAHVSVAIGLMGTVMAASAVRGARTGFQDSWSRAVLDGFGLHGFGHVAGSVAARGYTSGVLTAPTVVIPFWLWSLRALPADESAKSWRWGDVVLTAGAAFGTLVGIHALTLALLGEKSLGPRTDDRTAR